MSKEDDHVSFVLVLGVTKKVICFTRFECVLKKHDMAQLQASLDKWTKVLGVIPEIVSKKIKLFFIHRPSIDGKPVVAHKGLSKGWNLW
jgi:hypothetical protein